MCKNQRTLLHTLFLIFIAVMAAGCAGNIASKSESPSTADVARIASLSPDTAAAGSSTLTLHVTGANFVPGATVLWSGQPRKTTFASPQSLTATITSADLASPATAAVSVLNDPEGADSNAMAFTVGTDKKSLKITTSSLPNGETGSMYSATLSASGGTPGYRWSIAAGALPAGLHLNSQSGAISGNPTSSDTASFTVQVEDSSAAPASAEAKLALDVSSATSTPPSSPGTPSTAAEFYGPGLGSDGLANTTLGPSGNVVSYRMRVKHSGRLISIHPYLIMDHTGYFAGTGGTVLVSVQPDDGTAAHHPTGTQLATSLLPNPLAVTGSARYFPEFHISPVVTLTAGELIHIVFQNTDPAPTVNYVSVDSLYQAVATVPDQPTVSDTDSAVLLQEGGENWSPRAGFTPIIQLEYDDGTSEGIGYMEGWIGAPEPISGSSAVREAFTVSGAAKNVTSAHIRVARISGSDPLTIRLESADGTLIEQGSIPASAFSIGSQPNYTWGTYTFATNHVLEKGQTYHLDFEAPGSTTYQAFPIRKGVAYGFQPTTYFPDGYAQFEQNGSWVGWTQWGVTNRTDGDLQFYLTTH